MSIVEIITTVAPMIAGAITSIVIPCVIKAQTVKRLNKRIEEVNEGKTLRDIKEKLLSIENEILELRGKRK